MSGYLIEPIRDNEDFQGAFRTILRGQKQPNGWFSKETTVLTHFFQGYGRNSSCSGLLTCQGSLWNQSETMRTFQDPSGTSKSAQNSQIGDFKRRLQSWCIFQVYGRYSSCFGLLHMPGYLMEPIRDIEGIKGAVRNVNNSPKGPKWQKESFQRRWPSWHSLFKVRWDI